MWLSVLGTHSTYKGFYYLCSFKYLMMSYLVSLTGNKDNGNMAKMSQVSPIAQQGQRKLHMCFACNYRCTA